MLDGVAFRIVSLREEPELLERFLEYFIRHWGNPEIYRDCMTSCLASASPLPQWYMLLDAKGGIVGGVGLISNDFISRMDLWPWLCALYVEENARGRGLGAVLIDHVKAEAFRLGFTELHLCTDHRGYYEKFCFKYVGDGYHPWGERSRIYSLKLKNPQPVKVADSK